jgi:hypothetical protein
MSCISAFFAPRASMRRFLAAFTFKLAAVSFALATRISRTDYAVTYKIRDARSGALVDVEQTDLRAGANSAWSRGARWLIQRRLLER